MGPLTGIKVIELAGLGPAPICAVMLADLGAEVIRVERAAATGQEAPIDPLLRNRKSIALNLKNADAVDVVLDLIASADILIEGFRPGVMEKLGLGPEPCLQRNPALVYGRATGWGQDGPLSQSAGHDINYLAITGLLHQIGSPGGKPVPPLCFAGDFAAGGYLLAFGVMAALTSARSTGTGQVVDAAITDGAIAMMGIFYALRHTPLVRDQTGENYLAGAAPWYDTYRTRDGKYISIGPLEPQFFTRLLEKLQLDVNEWLPLGFPAVDEQSRQRWPELRAVLETKFASRTRGEWCDVLEGSDTCFAPVLSMAEALEHPHNIARNSFLEVEGVTQNAPVPRFSGTVPTTPKAPRKPGADTELVLSGAGYSDHQIAALRQSGALA